MSTTYQTNTNGCRMLLARRATRGMNITSIILMTILSLLLVSLAGCASAESSVQTLALSEPLGGATTAKINIDPGDGNLIIDPLTGSEQELASGTLQYLENQGTPSHTVNTTSGQASLTLKASSGSEQPWLRLPWAACNGATEWQVYLNPRVTSELVAHTDGGNVKLNLAGMVVTQLLADTGGGNIEVILPDSAASLTATVKTGAGDVTVALGSGVTGSSTVNASSGAGNVVVRLPAGTAARIHATSSIGKMVIDPRFSKLDATTYQSSDYDSATNRVEITVASGAGDVRIESN